MTSSAGTEQTPDFKHPAELTEHKKNCLSSVKNWADSFFKTFSLFLLEDVVSKNHVIREQFGLKKTLKII